MTPFSQFSIDQSSLLSLVPSAYVQAREEFLRAADAAECQTTSWPLITKGPQEESLAIDVARWGSSNSSRWLLISSGLHGTEGPFGTAVQLGFMRLLKRLEKDNTGVLFLHALNPYGYAWGRRVNESNVDLNRNFLLPGELYAGAPPLYRHVYEMFDPHRPLRSYENFYLRAWWLIARHSRAALQSSLPVGQYEYPKGLFFGGHRPEESHMLLRKHLREWMPQARTITHLDFHTGLGKWGDYRLLIDAAHDDPDVEWLRSWAGERHVETVSLIRTAYLPRGSLGPWLKKVVFPHCHYHYATAEFGTYGAVRVLRALVDELRTHFACQPDQPSYQIAKKMVRETFVPARPSWRVQAVSQGITLCRQCIQAMETR